MRSRESILVTSGNVETFYDCQAARRVVPIGPAPQAMETVGRLAVG
jgi:hypothetical protein